MQDKRNDWVKYGVKNLKVNKILKNVDNGVMFRIPIGKILTKGDNEKTQSRELIEENVYPIVAIHHGINQQEQPLWKPKYKFNHKESPPN